MATTIIPFNSLVLDKVTGFKGIVIARVEHMNGCTRYGVQAKIGKDNKRPDPVFIDATGLTVIAPPKDNLAKANEVPNSYEFGVKVRDLLTGLTGIVVARVKHRYSGDRYGIQPPMDKDGSIPESVQLDEEDLEQIDPPVSKKKNTEKEKKPPNGPHDSHSPFGR